MPASRVAASLVGFARSGERWMVAIPAAILIASPAESSSALRWAWRGLSRPWMSPSSIALLAILPGAELFTNGVEWAGHKLDSLRCGRLVLAAVGRSCRRRRSRSSS
jgi:hypothetical protein